METLKLVILIGLLGMVFGICDDTEYTCGNGKCLTRDYRCDGYNDCNDQTDEIGCPPCSCSEFTCDDKTCIPANFSCDAYVDCSNGEDDIGCGACGWNQYECLNHNCIAEDRICDGENDCQDWSDEDGCENYGCGANEFTCGNQNCIPDVYICDGVNDCADNSDEQGCSAKRAFHTVVSSNRDLKGSAHRKTIRVQARGKGKRGNHVSRTRKVDVTRLISKNMLKASTDKVMRRLKAEVTRERSVAKGNRQDKFARTNDKTRTT